MGHAEAAIAPFRKLGKPLSDDLRSRPYVELQMQDDERARIGGRYYTKSGFLKNLDRDLIEAMLDTAADATIPKFRIAMPAKGGAIGRVPRDATAFWHRDAKFSLILQSAGDIPAEDANNVAWVKAQWPALEAFTKGFYANTNLTDTPSERTREAYGGNFERLRTVKSKYDAGNLFRLNANIEPRA
jgi:hypothetical protein